MGMTPQQFHTIPTFCAILPAMHTTKLSTCTLAYSHPLKECITTLRQGIQHCSLHSLPHSRQPYVPCSAATKVHNITDTSTCHTDSALLKHSIASAYKTDHICHAQWQLSLSHPQHNLSMHINMHYTTTLPTAFHNAPMHTTNTRCSIFSLLNFNSIGRLVCTEIQSII